MNQRIREITERISGYWKQLQAHQRRNLLIAGGVFVLTVALLGWFAFRPNYVAVYSNLEAGAAGEIVAKLDEMKIPNKIQGTTVLVPEEYADRARVQLAMNNLPKSGNIDFGIFNDKSIGGMTEKEFDVKYLTALQGSIANTVRSIKGVEDAKVHIVMPDQKLFVRENLQDAKASVFVKMAPGAKLEQEQVVGIQRLVAGSVKGLKPENITIVDQNGVQLLDDSQVAGSKGLGPAAAKELEVRRLIQQDYEKKIRNALEKIYGYGNVEVIVNPEVSFDQVQRTDEQYSAPIQGSDQGLVRSEQRTSETFENAAPGGGAAGNAANNVNAQVKTASGSTSNGEKRSQTTNYELNKAIIQTVGQAFKINSVSVSVLVNGDINNQQKQDITNLVFNAIKNPADPADAANARVTVMGGKFQTPPNPFESAAWYKNPWVIGGIAAGLLLLGGGAYVIARRRKGEEEREEEIQPAPVVTLEPIPEDTSQQQIKKQLEKMINQKPEEFTNLLRTWLAED